MESTENKRVFINPEDNKEYYIVSPTADDIRGADWQYSKVYTKSLVEGITTSAEMMDILRRRGIIGPEFEQRQNELANTLAVKIMELQTAIEIDKKQLLALEVANAREELFNWNQRLNGPMSNTCEQMADDARLEYLTYRMVENKDGSKVWASYDNFLKERNKTLSNRTRFEVMLYIQGLDSNFMEQVPEAIAMREIEDELKRKATKAIEELSKQQKEDEAEAAAVLKVKKPKSSNKKSSDKSVS
ncbi:MAG: hypothetical protein WC346_08775 [Methanogenium sp.]|jgi:hypothetical protein